MLLCTTTSLPFALSLFPSAAWSELDGAGLPPPARRDFPARLSVGVLYPSFSIRVHSHSCRHHLQSLCLSPIEVESSLVKGGCTTSALGMTNKVLSDVKWTSSTFRFQLHVEPTGSDHRWPSTAIPYFASGPCPATQHGPWGL